MAHNVRPTYPRMLQRAIALASEVTAGRLAPMTRVAFRQELLAAELGDEYAPGRPNGLSYTKWQQLTGSHSRENTGRYGQYERQVTGTVGWHLLGAGKVPQRLERIATAIRSGRKTAPSREEFLAEGLQMETNVPGLLEGIYALLARQLDWDTYPRQPRVSDYLAAAPNPPKSSPPKKKKWLEPQEFLKALQAIFPPEWRESADVSHQRIMTINPGAIRGFQIIDVAGEGETASVTITALQQHRHLRSFTGYYELTLTKVRTRTGEILSLAVRERVGDRPGHKAGRNETGHYLTPS